MKVKFIIFSALIGAASTFCLNSAMSAPVTEPTSLAALLSSKKQVKAPDAEAGKKAVEQKPSAKVTKKSKAASKKAQTVQKSKKASKAKPAVLTKQSGKSSVKANKAKRVSAVKKSSNPMTVKEAKQKTSTALEAAKAHQYSPIISRYAENYGVPVDLAHAVVHTESRFQPDVRGAAGEIGLMQIKLSTARGLGYSGSAKGLYEPATNIQYGMKYLAKARELSDGSTCGTILKYNAGHGAKRMNPTSAKYCNKVVSYIGRN